MRRENSAKWKMTKFKRVGQSPAPLPEGTAWKLCFPVYGALYSGIMQQAPRSSLLLQNLGSLALPYWDGPLDSNARVCEFGEILKRAKTAAFYL